MGENTYREKIKKYKQYKKVLTYNPNEKNKVEDELKKLNKKIEKTYSYRINGNDSALNSEIENKFSQEIKNNSNKMKFADTCIDMMMEELMKKNVTKSALKAKIAGGAQMFSVSLKSDNLNIGKRNAEAVKAKLKSLNIPLIAEDIHGNSGRTITFDIETTNLNIKSIGKGDSVI